MKDQTHVDTTNQPASELTHISLCAGYGGIDLGLHRVFGQKLRTIAFSEIEAFAVENLLAKMEAGLLPAAPVWTDLRTFPWADFQGVDLLSGGFPCQPFSAAGKRNADSDPRHLFPAIVEGIRHAKPGIVFLENVEGIVSAKLAGDDWRDPAGTPVLLHVLRELERVGYKATAGIFSASECGAPHQRKRVFILAYRNEPGWQARWHNAISSQGRQPHELAACGGDQGGGEELADSQCAGLERQHNRNAPTEPTEYVGADAWASGECDAWPSRPGELANAQLHGRDHANARPNADGIQGPLGQGHEHRQALGDGQLWPSRPGELGNAMQPDRQSNEAQQADAKWQCAAGSPSGDADIRWPSRPGEPQHEWEPPRVCGGLAHTGSLGRRGRSDGDEGGLRGEIQVEGSCGSGAEEAMGGSSQREDHGRESRDMGLAPSQGGCGNDAADCTGEDGGLADSLQRRSDGWSNGIGGRIGQPSEDEATNGRRDECKIEPPLGLRSHGTKSRLGVAELSGLSDQELAEIRHWMVASDNRTDELRLLGNGVVPATAERAFVTLMQELTK